MASDSVEIMHITVIEHIISQIYCVYKDMDVKMAVIFMNRKDNLVLSMTYEFIYKYYAYIKNKEQELQLKTFSSKRVLPLPDLVFEAIVEERKQYEKNRRRRGKYFFDGDYICCSTYGKPRSKDFHWKHYKQLLQETGLPDIRWHDLRSTYCTLLLKNNFSPKAVSKLMGHARELITMDVYGDNGNIIAEEIPPELLSYMEEVLPEKKKDNTENVLNTMINVEKNKELMFVLYIQFHISMI